MGDASVPCEEMQVAGKSTSVGPGTRMSPAPASTSVGCSSWKGLPSAMARRREISSAVDVSSSSSKCLQQHSQVMRLVAHSTVQCHVPTAVSICFVYERRSERGSFRMCRWCQIHMFQHARRSQLRCMAQDVFDRSADFWCSSKASSSCCRFRIWSSLRFSLAVSASMISRCFTRSCV